MQKTEDKVRVTLDSEKVSARGDLHDDSVAASGGIEEPSGLVGEEVPTCRSSQEPFHFERSALAEVRRQAEIRCKLNAGASNTTHGAPGIILP